MRHIDNITNQELLQRIFLKHSYGFEKQKDIAQRIKTDPAYKRIIIEKLDKIRIKKGGKKIAELQRLRARKTIDKKIGMGVKIGESSIDFAELRRDTPNTTAWIYNGFSSFLRETVNQTTNAIKTTKDYVTGFKLPRINFSRFTGDNTENIWKEFERKLKDPKTSPERRRVITAAIRAKKENEKFNRGCHKRFCFGFATASLLLAPVSLAAFLAYNNLTEKNQNPFTNLEKKVVEKIDFFPQQLIRDVSGFLRKVSYMGNDNVDSEPLFAISDPYLIKKVKVRCDKKIEDPWEISGLNLFLYNIESYEPYIEKAYKDLGIPKTLTRAFIREESNGNKYAKSPVGARGLMQLMPDTARKYGLTINKRVDERLNPEKNIAAGTKYLRDLIDLYEGDTAKAIASYNWGENAVMDIYVGLGYEKDNLPRETMWKAIRGPLPRETQEFVQKVLDTQLRLQHLEKRVGCLGIPRIIEV